MGTDAAHLKPAGLFRPASPSVMVGQASLGGKVSTTLLLHELTEALVRADGLDARWNLLTGQFARLGADQINYGVWDSSAPVDPGDTPVRFLSTMRADWIDYYGERRLDRYDAHVGLVRNGNLQPYRWKEESLDRLTDPREHEVLALAREAGLNIQVQVTMPDPLGGRLPAGGMAVGSSLRERDYFGSIEGCEAQVIAVACLFHQLSIGDVRRRLHNAAPLSRRERDVLAFLADGLRIDAIAARLQVAQATVELHLRNARRKLGAATSPEAVARALLFGDIRLS
jgi:LuxR family quorum-sensing system transcriptional regulator CciR